MVAAHSDGRPTQQYYLATYRPLPAATVADPETLRQDGIPIDPRVTSLEYGTQIGQGTFGGFSDLRAGYAAEFLADDGPRRTAWLDHPVELPENGHVVLRTGVGGVAWEGRRTSAEWDGGRVVGFQAAGYGVVAVEDAPLPQMPSISTTSAALLAYALLSVTPPFRIGTRIAFRDPGVAHTTAEFSGQTPGAIINQLTRIGGAANVLFDFYVYENRTAFFLPRTPPDIPQYQIPYERGLVRDTTDDTQLYSRIRLSYTDASSGVAVTQEFQNTAFPFAFDRCKPVSGGTMNGAAAAQFAATWLALHGTRWRSITVSRHDGAGIPWYGTEVDRPPCYVRSAQWALVGNDGPYVITSTRVTAHTGEFTCTLSQPESGWPQELQLIRQAAAAVQRGYVVSTGSVAA